MRPVLNRLGAMAIDADAEAAEVARHRERHPGDAGLGRGVGDLADLALEGGDRGGVDRSRRARRPRARSSPCGTPAGG